MCMYVYTHSFRGPQKSEEDSDSPELELQTVVSKSTNVF